MFLTIILSQILAVFCQRDKNIEIELQYDIDGGFEDLKIRNVRPLPRDIPEDYEAPKVVPAETVNRDKHGYTNNVGKFPYRRMNYRGTSKQSINIEQSELGLKPRQVEPLYEFRRMTGNNKNVNGINFRKTVEIRGIKNYNATMNTNDWVSLLPIERRKKNLQPTTLPPQDRDRKAASEVYKFLKVSLAMPRKKEIAPLNVQIPRKISIITKENKNNNAELLKLSKETHLLATDLEHESKPLSTLSKKGNNFMSLKSDENKTKTLIDIVKAIELITSQNAKDALSQLSALSLDSQTNTSVYIKTPTKSSELKFPSEYLKGSNLTDREKQLELELKKIRKEINLFTPEKDQKLSTLDIFSASVRPTINVSPFSYEYSNPTTTETTKTLLTTTKVAAIAQFDFNNIMKYREAYLKLENRSETEAHGIHEEKSINDTEGSEVSLTATRKTNIFPDSLNLGRNFLTLPERNKQISTEAQIDFNVREKQSNSVLERLNKLLNLSLLQRLAETKQEVPSKVVHQTAVTNFVTSRLTRKRSNRPKFTPRTNRMQRLRKLRVHRKHTTKNRKLIKESDIDTFRKQLRMEYDSFE
ncbi:uncharacterized protein LOC113232861 isoform X2 [Hyposmocoma kahamanoa]|uniref:uncharacterized protein LOC113232861 isoform X2 n=1 Tax=Hyposmocoma kahamanoa TaxID=1477025 RepID=UPI000E6D5DD2|nr:uncharacterized protein LOC113232861 isoform X2 [Hyposmocoma kahamanoa]